MRFVPSIRKLIVNTTILSFAKFSVCSLSMINPPNYAVRKAESRDLPQIHGLIKDSFAAMNEYFPDPAMHDMMAKVDHVTVSFSCKFYDKSISILILSFLRFECKYLHRFLIVGSTIYV